mmetsp:Transcript_23354/g.55600  ORF Transcript_23354/g.55600 Transcript_23354/m.55600 type:complete len:217 (-) Transcript_23354:705-1355(-)
MRHARNLLVRRPAPQHVPQAHLFRAEEAALDVAVSSDAEAVAGAAEVLAHRGDEPDSALEPRNLPGLGGVVGLVALGRALEAREARLDALEHLRVAHKLGVLPLVAVERHVLDEAHVDARVLRKRHKVRHLLLVQPPHHHAVDLERAQPRQRVVLGLLRHLQTFLRVLEAVAARDEEELLLVQRVQRHVDPIQPALQQPVQLLVQSDPVGRDPDPL